MKVLCIIIVVFAFIIESLEGCHVGWMQFQEKCYFFSHTTASWFDAGGACAQFHSKLAEPRTQTASNYLKSHSQALNANFWIGISDIIEENIWEYSSTQEIVKETDFGPGEPNSHTAQNCVALWRDFHGQWADHTCSAPLHFICEADFPSDPGSIIG
ncbi:perlucin-like [Saccostrea cucullata]|uniref:perlucin-like n=1 Tax=Saccostrea cuccullata TaxID=36930 RepID=UPI002ED11319